MRRLHLTDAIVFSMLAGTAVGIFWPHLGIHMQPLAAVFLRLIKVVVGPLIFATLVVGIAAHGDLRQVGRIGIKAIVYFEILTTVALFLGLGAANLVRPGAGVRLTATPGPGAETVQPSQGLLDSIIRHAVPQSFAEALASGEVLQIVAFSVLFGCALAALPSNRAAPLLAVCDSLAQVMFRFTDYVMWTAPFGIFGALAFSIGSHGISVLLPLFKLVATLYGTLVVFVVFAFGAVILLARIPLRPFLAAVREPVLIAFSTASSEAALPSALENMQRMGVSNRVAGFVLPTGYSFNLDGSTLYLSLAAIFLAQATGQDLSVGRQLFILLTLMLTSKGVAGVARAAIVILTATASGLGLPLEGVALLLGVDQFMDMARTAVNVLGNCLATAVVARWEGEELAPAATQHT